MAETLRELVFALSLDSSNFSRNMRSIYQQIKLNHQKTVPLGGHIISAIIPEKNVWRYNILFLVMAQDFFLCRQVIHILEGKLPVLLNRLIHRIQCGKCHRAVRLDSIRAECCGDKILPVHLRGHFRKPTDQCITCCALE